jgi:hypothetical protein
MQTAGSRAEYPAGVWSVNGFSFFNAVSFQIMLGPPVVLYAKSLGATSLVLGTIAALTPLLTTMQLVAARFLHRSGYKKFVLAGWAARTFFTALIALLPLWPGLEPSWRLTFLLAALVAFNFLRGFASGAWLPWMAALVPEEVRGRFFSRDQAFLQLGCLLSLLVSAWVMAGTVEMVEYSVVFGIGLAAAVVSLCFIQRIPDAISPEERKKSGQTVPWAAMLRYAPFARLLFFTTVYMTVIGGFGVFTVEYLAVRQKLSEGTILLLSSVSFAGALSGLAWAGPRLDATGSKPWLRRAVLLLAMVIGVWTLLAADILPGWIGLVGALNFAGGVAGAVFAASNTRIMLGSVPVMGRNHFFALFTVVTSLGLGGAPMAWGAVLDTMGSLEVVAGAFSLNRYTIYFSVLMVVALWDWWLAGRLHEGAEGVATFPSSAEARPTVPVE